MSERTEIDMENLSVCVEDAKQMIKHLEEASKTLSATSIKQKVAPVSNRLVSFIEWVENIEDKEEIDLALRNMKSTPEGRVELRRFLKSQVKE